MTEEPQYMFTLDEEGVQLNMNFICPQCNLELSEHDVEVFLENMPSHVTFQCPEIEEEED